MGGSLLCRGTVTPWHLGRKRIETSKQRGSFQIVRQGSGAWKINPSQPPAFSGSRAGGPRPQVASRVSEGRAGESAEALKVGQPAAPGYRASVI